MSQPAPSWNDLLSELNNDVSREQPSDLIQWGADWFQARLRKDRNSHSSAGPTKRGPPGNLAFNTPGIQSMHAHAPAPSPFSESGPTDSPFGGPRRATAPAGGPPSGSGTHSGSNLAGTPLFASPFASTPIAPPITGVESSPFSGERPVFDNSPFGQMEQHHDEPDVPSYALGRRTSVSAESLVPANQRSMAHSSGLGTTLEEDEDTPNQPSMPVFPKSEEQLHRIKTAIQPNFLFRSLTEEQEADVLAAMKEVKIGAGEMIIEQGAAGDYFYIVESGELDVFVKREGQVIEEANGDRALLGKKVATCVEGNSFGELALMHNAPRAASILSKTPCTLWALDRVSFRTILLDHTSRKRRLYESFLSEVPILSSLQPQERAKIADVLESRTFVEGEDVILEGDAGEEFFLIESGTASAIKGDDTVVKQYVKGDYFGELALLNRQARAASVRATSDKLVVATLGEQAFTRLLGPVKNIMARSVGERYGFAGSR